VGDDEVAVTRPFCFVVGIALVVIGCFGPVVFGVVHAHAAQVWEWLEYITAPCRGVVQWIVGSTAGGGATATAAIVRWAPVVGDLHLDITENIGYIRELPCYVGDFLLP